MLTSLFQLSATQSLVLLEDLSILGCEQLKSIITNDEDLGKEIFEGDNDDNMVVQCFQICSYQNLEP